MVESAGHHHIHTTRPNPKLGRSSSRAAAPRRVCWTTWASPTPTEVHPSPTATRQTGVLSLTLSPDTPVAAVAASTVASCPRLARTSPPRYTPPPPPTPSPTPTPTPTPAPTPTPNQVRARARPTQRALPCHPSAPPRAPRLTPRLARQRARPCRPTLRPAPPTASNGEATPPHF